MLAAPGRTAGRAPEARRELDTVVTFANVVAETDEASADAGGGGVPRGARRRRARPGYSAWERGGRRRAGADRARRGRPRVRHGGGHRRHRGQLPEPVQARADVRPGGARAPVTNAERNCATASTTSGGSSTWCSRGRSAAWCSCAPTRTPTPTSDRPARGSSTRPVDSGAGRAVRRPRVSTREAAAAWRSQLADQRPAWQRLAALDGLVALQVDAGRWWFQRDWTDTGRPLHETIRVSYSRLSNLGGLRADARARRRARARPAGRLPRVGGQDRAHDPRAGREGRDREGPPADGGGARARWRHRSSPRGGVRGVPATRPSTTMLRNWFENYAERPAVGIERFFEFEFEGPP